ncbi:MAG TPA: capsule assembly Wzi family protein [Gemmatimonadota bacterium]|nr:capsule assembly Wzi family protein [Gemmatimonadota bacterium]
MAVSFLVACLALPAAGRAQSLRTVPTDHWAYDVADQALLRHPELGRGLWLANRPWREADFRLLVARADSAGVRAEDPGAGGWLDLLSEAFPPDAASEEGVYYHNEVSAYAAVDARKDDVTFEPAFAAPMFGDSVGEPIARAFVQHDFGVQFRESFVLGWRYAVDSNVRNDPTRFRQEEVRSGEEFGFAILDAYGTAHWGPLWVTVGRTAFEWGPGRASAVFVSDSIPPLDQARIELGPPRVRFTGVIARLSSDSQNRSLDADGEPIQGSEPPEAGLREVTRYLYLHRLDWQPWPRLQVAVGEAALVTGFDRGLEFRYANLLTPFFITQKDEDEPDALQVNLFVDAELVATPVDGLRVYGHAFVQDFQLFDRGENETPDQYAVRFGGELGPPGWPVTGGMEYTRVLSFMYLHRGLNTNWSQFGVPIGSMLGPDADMGLAWLDWWVRPATRVTAEAMARRGGENSMATLESVGGAGYDFPRGTSQKELRLALEGWTLLPAWGLEATGRVSWRDVTSVANSPGEDEGYWRAALSLRWRHEFGRR